MKHLIERACVLMAGLALAASSWATTLHGVVFVVIDGDTVLFRPDHASPSTRSFMKLRLADIDAPEADQPQGDAATRELRQLVLHQRVEIDIVATDAYGRAIARIRSGPVLVNQELVRRGLAWASTRARSDAVLLDAQKAAQRERRGLWVAPDPIPPWTWRTLQPSSVN